MSFGQRERAREILSMLPSVDREVVEDEMSDRANVPRVVAVVMALACLAQATVIVTHICHPHDGDPGLNELHAWQAEAISLRRDVADLKVEVADCDAEWTAHEALDLALERASVRCWVPEYDPGAR